MSILITKNNCGSIVEPRRSSYGFRTHKKQSTSPRKFIPNNRNELQNVKIVPKFQMKVHNVGFMSIWVRSMDLSPCMALPTNPHDDLGTSRGLDFAI